MSSHCTEQANDAIVFSSIKHVGNVPGKVNSGQKKNREIPVVTIVTSTGDRGVRKVLVWLRKT